MSEQVFDPASQVVQISAKAAAKVQEFIAEEGNPGLLLRVFVTGGGCSGFQYGFSFDEVKAEDDSLFVQHGINIVVDALSYQYLIGATVEYEETIAGSRFSINNPNATTTCGCGSSFSV